MERRRIGRWAPVIALLLLTSGAASGEETEPEEFGRSGPYVAVVAGYAYDISGAVTHYGVTTTMAQTGSPVVGIRGGYRLDPPVAVELQLDYLTGADASATVLPGGPPIPVPPGSVGSYDVSALSFTPNVRVHLLPGRIQPYTVFGIGLFWSQIGDASPGLGLYDDWSEVSFLVRVGGGLALQIDDHIALELGAEYIRPYGNNSQFRHVGFTGALLYKF
jgi:opacity protein-like surface antigen